MPIYIMGTGTMYFIALPIYESMDGIMAVLYGIAGKKYNPPGKAGAAVTPASVQE